jgi:hypothetical protein
VELFVASGGVRRAAAIRSASILLAMLAGNACQSESLSALAVAAKMAALRMHGILSTR